LAQDETPPLKVVEAQVFRLVGPDGQTRGSLGVEPDGTTALNLRDEAGRLRLQASVGTTVSSLWLAGERDRPRASTMASPSGADLLLSGTDEHSSLYATVLGEERGNPVLDLTDAHGRVVWSSLLTPLAPLPTPAAGDPGRLTPDNTREVWVTLADGSASVRNLAFRELVGSLKVIGQVKTSGIVNQTTKPVMYKYSLSVFGPTGELLGGQEFTVFGRAGSSVQAFEVLFPDIRAHEAASVEIAGQGAWTTKD